MDKAFAMLLRQWWGNQHCNHAALDKETDLGKDTGNWACISCGRIMLPVEWDRLRYGLSKSDDADEKSSR